MDDDIFSESWSDDESKDTENKDVAENLLEQRISLRRITHEFFKLSIFIASILFIIALVEWSMYGYSQLFPNVYFLNIKSWGTDLSTDCNHEDGFLFYQRKWMTLKQHGLPPQ